MNPYDYLLQVLDNFQLIKIFVLVYPLLLIINKLVFNKFFNGLFVLAFSSAIVFSVIIDLFLSSQIDVSRLLYFIFSDVLIYACILYIYKRITTTVNKDQILGIFKVINEKHFNKVSAWLLIGITINLVNVGFDGTSRIAFQTNSWFSIVRMISLLIDPVVGLLMIYNLYEKNYSKLGKLLFLIVASSASAGSKSGFVFGFIESFLIYRDLVNVKSTISAKVYIPLVSFIIGAMFLNFYFLGVDFDKVFERLVHYAESTIMVYPSKNPCVVCQGQSMIGLIHRGIGRAIHDPSSLNIDNLFGFALSKEFYGENTFTGPNARIGAYAICAFPGFKIAILYTVFIVFLGINYLTMKITQRKSNFLYLTTILIVFHATQHFVLDYNTAMSDLSLLLMILLFLAIQLILNIDPFKIDLNGEQGNNSRQHYPPNYKLPN